MFCSSLRISYAGRHKQNVAGICHAKPATTKPNPTISKSGMGTARLWQGYICSHRIMFLTYRAPLLIACAAIKRRSV